MPGHSTIFRNARFEHSHVTQHMQSICCCVFIALLLNIIMHTHTAADTATDMGLKEEATSLDLQSLAKMDDGQATLADVTFNFVDTLLCYATEKSNRVSNVDVAIVFLIAANVVSQSSDEAQSVIIAKIAETPYIRGVVKNVCLSLQCDSGMSCMIAQARTTCNMQLYIYRGPK